MSATDDDGYDGPADLLVGDDGTHDVVPVTVTLRGHFDPISGSYYWYGRVQGSDAVARLVADGGREVVLRTPHAAVPTTLADLDPWGRPRVDGFGAAPFDVAGEPSDNLWSEHRHQPAPAGD